MISSLFAVLNALKCSSFLFDIRSGSMICCINADDLLARLMTDKDSTRPIVAGFLADMTTHVLALKNSLHIGDRLMVQRQAHTISGAAANVSCNRLKEAAGKIEEAGGAGDLEKAAALMPGLEAQIALIKEVMKQTGWIE